MPPKTRLSTQAIKDVELLERGTYYTPINGKLFLDNRRGDTGDIGGRGKGEGGTQARVMPWISSALRRKEIMRFSVIRPFPLQRRCN